MFKFVIYLMCTIGSQSCLARRWLWQADTIWILFAWMYRWVRFFLIMTIYKIHDCYNLCCLIIADFQGRFYGCMLHLQTTILVLYCTITWRQLKKWKVCRTCIHINIYLCQNLIYCIYRVSSCCTHGQRNWEQQTCSSSGSISHKPLWWTCRWEKCSIWHISCQRC